MSAALDTISSLKTKLGLLVGTSVLVTGVLTAVGTAAGVPALLVVPVSIALALGITQLLAAGMVSPLRQMTTVAQAMARGDYSGRVHTTSTDEVGQLAAAFNTMAEDLAAVDAERRDLLATVSHELRTPLTAMTATLENLADGVVSPDPDALHAALLQAERLRDLVADLLDLSRLEGGATTLRVEPFSLRALVEECVQHVRLAGRTSPFDVQVPSDLSVEADRARLSQLVVNVLDNASRHSPPDTAVTILAAEGEAGWSLDVVDSGPGVAPGDRDRVFTRWGTAGAAGGTGLGLAISQWVARLHGGTLRFVDPPSGVGARVRLTVPFDPTEAPTRVPESTAMPEPARQPAVAFPLAAAPSGLDGLFGSFWPDLSRTGRLAVLASALAGAFGGAVMSFTEPGISWTLLLLVAGAAAYAFARDRATPWTITCTVLAVLLVLPLTLLGATWIGLLGALAAAAVFLVGLTGARTPAGVFLTGISWPLASLRGLPWFGRSLRPGGGSARTPAVVRTVVWSLLALAVFGAIFASADAVFASWIDVLVPNLTFTTFVGRVFVACGVFAMTLAAAFLGINPPRVDLPGERMPVILRNRFEWLVPVLVIDAVFIVFLVAQASAFFGGHDYVERTTGLTYADYVHQGFGQLTLATALTLVVVWIASRRAAPHAADQRWLKASLGLLCGLTLVVVASALNRMHVYQEAYGFTSLRLFVDVFEGWLGFLVLAVMVAGLLGRGRWVPRVAVVSGAVAVLALAAINPDGWVAGQNIDRFEATGKVDLYYLESLSVDAVPVISERLPADIAECVLAQQLHNGLRSETLSDPRAWNLGRERAAAVTTGLDLPFSPHAPGGRCAQVWEAYGG
jgi:two-component system sensor histidine kinase BaeS